MRIAWTVLGLGMTGLGLVGAVVPLLPTTPFLLLGVACFSRGSETLRDRVLALPVVGAPLAEWRRTRRIRPVVRRRALLLLWSGLLVSAWLCWPATYPVIGLLLVGIAVSSALLLVGRSQTKPL